MTKVNRVNHNLIKTNMKESPEKETLSYCVFIRQYLFIRHAGINEWE